MRVSFSLSGDQSAFSIRDAITLSGITDVYVDTSSVVRVSDTQATVELEFYGNITTDSTLTVSLGAEAIEDYDGAALTSQISVSAVTESIAASTDAPLTEATLFGSVVTLTLSGRKYERSDSRIRDAVSVSGISGIIVRSFDIARESDTEVSVELRDITTDGTIPFTDGTLTFTVGADAIASYTGPALTAQVTVYAQPDGTIRLTTSTAAPLTEETLHEGVITLSLSGGIFDQSAFSIRDAITLSGITDVYVDTSSVVRVSDTQATVELEFYGNITTDSTLTVSLGAEAIEDYDGAALTSQISVSAVTESIAASTDAPLTEATLAGSVVTLTLSGRKYERSDSRIRDAVSVSGVAGVTVSTSDIERISDTEVTIELSFDGDITADGTLTFTVGAGAIASYNGPALTAQASVSATSTTTPANRAPVFTDGSSTTRTIAENTASGVNIGSAVAATDADTDTLTYTLGGTDAAAFSIVSTSGQLQTNASLDYETKISYSVTVSVSDGNSGSDSITVTINITDVNATPTISVSSNPPLTEETLHEGVITLSLSGSTFEPLTASIKDAIILSGTDIIVGIRTFDVERVSDTEVKVELEYDGNMTTNGNLTISLGAEAIKDYDGAALTSQISVSAVTESVAASTDALLTEATLVGSVVTLTLSGRKYELSNIDIRDAVSVSGTSGITVRSFDIARESDTEVTVELRDITNDGTLTFIDGTLTFTVSADAIAGYTGPALTAQVTVYAQPDGTIRLTTSTAAPLTEETLHESVITLDLIGGIFDQSAFSIRDAITLSGITDVYVDTFRVVRVSDTQATVELEFYGNITTDSTLTVSLGAEAIEDYDGAALTSQISVSAVTESIAASTDAPLTEATLAGSVVTLTLSGRKYERSNSRIRGAVSVSGIAGVTVGRLGVDRISDTEVTVELTFDGDITTDGTLTFTVGAGAIASYNGPALTAQASVSATSTTTSANRAPVFTDGSSTTRTIAENTASGVNIGSPVAATDADTDTLTYTLGGTDAAAFNIVSTSGQLQTNASLDYEIKSSYEVTVTATDDSEASNNSAAIAVTINVTDVDEGEITPVSDRTSAVRDAIVNAITGVDDAAEVTEAHLATITTLSIESETLTSLSVGDFDGLTGLNVLGLSSNPNLTTLPSGIFDGLTALTKINLETCGLTSLPSDVFDGLTSLERLILFSNQLSSLPAGIFDDLTSLTKLDLSGNRFTTIPSGILVNLTSLTTFKIGNNYDENGDVVAQLPLPVSLELVQSGELKAVVPTGAPFDIIVPLNITNGSLRELQPFRDGARLPISKGSVESLSLFVERTAGTTAAVTVNIGSLPNKPRGHSGYRLVKSDDLPLEVIPAVNGAPSNNNQQIPDGTVFLPNYPNPFNPETWMPYQLANASDVTFTIYNMRGIVVRELALGHKSAGYYTSKNRAAYWDGRNNLGEKVAAGMYFSTFKTKDYTATRKMLIRK